MDSPSCPIRVSWPSMQDQYDVSKNSVTSSYSSVTEEIELYS